MVKRVRIVHYLNQFFGGFGGEAHANMPLEIRNGPVGPGRLLDSLAADRGEVVATIIGGDNYLADETATALVTARSALEEIRPDVVVAGPAFDAGRYGYACGAVCAKATSDLGIPSMAAMFPDNPGVALFRRQVYIIPTGTHAAEMSKVLPKVARFALKLGSAESIGSATEEGYLPRGIRKPARASKPGYERAAEMLVARMLGKPWASEIGVQSYEVVAPSPPVRQLATATIALITSGGLVPRGDPDGLRGGRIRDFVRCSIDGVESLSVSDWESVHTGFSTVAINTHNPAYVLPLPAMRLREREGSIGALYPYYFSTIGAGTFLQDAKRMGRAIAAELKASGVDAALLVAT
jgi:glycine reductase